MNPEDLRNYLNSFKNNKNYAEAYPEIYKELVEKIQTRLSQLSDQTGQPRGLLTSRRPWTSTKGGRRTRRNNKSKRSTLRR